MPDTASGRTPHLPRLRHNRFSKLSRNVTIGLVTHSAAKLLPASWCVTSAPSEICKTLLSQDLFQTTFDQLPIACLVANKILCVHGGVGDGRRDPQAKSVGYIYRQTMVGSVFQVGSQ